MENITEIEGDLFLAPEGAALIRTSFYATHSYTSDTLTRCFIDACNCQGSWGKGIALEFKNRV